MGHPKDRRRIFYFKIILFSTSSGGGLARFFRFRLSFWIFHNRHTTVVPLVWQTDRILQYGRDAGIADWTAKRMMNDSTICARVIFSAAHFFFLFRFCLLSLYFLISDRSYKEATLSLSLFKMDIGLDASISFVHIQTGCCAGINRLVPPFPPYARPYETIGPNT